MILFWIIEWLAGITESLIGFLFVGRILGTKAERHRMVFILSAVLALGLLILNYFSLFSFSGTIYGVTAMAICACILYKRNVMDIMVAVGSYFLLIHLIDFFLIASIETLTGINAFGSVITARLSVGRSVYILISKTALVFIYLLICRFRGSLSAPSGKLIIGILMALVLIFNLEKMIYQQMRVELIGIGFFVLLMVIMGIYLTIQYTEIREVKIQVELLNERNKVMARGYEDMLENYKNSSVYFHDLKHQIMRIEQLLQDHKIEEALDYIRGLEPDHRGIRDLTWTGTALIDFILNYKKVIAEKQEIRFEIEADLVQIRDISEADLCALLGNVIDNAIEHCEKEVVRPEVRVAVRKIHEMLVIKVTNTCIHLPQRENKRFTSKNDQKTHGWGMKSIEMIVEKYGGAMLCEYQNNKYSVMLTFFH